MEAVPFGLRQLVPLMNIPVKDFSPNDSFSYGKCPYCQDDKPRLKIFFESDTWKCFHCGRSGGMLELYAFSVLGRNTYTSEAGSAAYKDALRRLHLESPDVFRKKTAAVSAHKQTLTSNTPKNASVEVRNKTYNGLLNLDVMDLADEHYAELSRRGFTEGEIVQNQYRSFARALPWACEKAAEDAYEVIAPLLQKYPKLQKSTRSEILAGLLIGMALKGSGCEMEGVPGFFKLGDFWMFYVVQNAIVIPLRNMRGQIVALQCKLMAGKTRYLTVSSSGLPHGCSPEDQYHVPIGGEPIEDATMCVLTEGPLKGDALVALSDKPVMALCILGVNNVSKLPALFAEMKAAGVQRIINALDMDRFLNRNVRKAVRKIVQLARDADLACSQLCWDAPRAEQHCQAFSQLLATQNISYTSSGNTYKDLWVLCGLLDKHNIDHPKQWDAPDALTKHKGIDDMLLSLRS